MEQGVAQPPRFLRRTDGSLLHLYDNGLPAFRCIAVDRTQLNLALHDNDGELGFYKFYYQLLHHWILDFNAYRIFCDVKSNRDPKRLPVLARCLARANLTSSMDGIQSLPFHEVVLIQLCDLLLGAQPHQRHPA